MPEDSTDPITRFQAEIAALRQAIARLDGLPESQAPLQAQLALKEAELSALQAAPAVGAVSANRDVTIGTNVQVTNFGGAGSDTYIGGQITITQYLALDPQTKRHHLQAYLATLHDLAARSRARASDDPQPAGASVDTAAEAELRRIFARALLDWQLPTPSGDTPADDLLRRRLIASLLMPLIRDLRVMMRPRYDWALTRLSSGYITSLVLNASARFRPGDPDAERQALRTLTEHLADSRYSAGCARLLEDLADPERGLTAVAEAYEELPAEQQAHIPDGLLLLATGALVGGVAGAIIALLVTELRTPLTAHSAPREVASPATTATPGPLRIPVTLDDWRFELGRRNEQFGAPDGYWCYLRPGSYRIGGWEKDQAEANLRLDAFWIARVPFTVAQYAQFMRAGGYRTRRWWTPNGWEWRVAQKREQSYRWQEPPYNSRPEQALQGISWYEATACCAWLAELLERDLPPGYSLRLPSEAEWEAAAACGHDGERREYPWGVQEPTQKLAVFDRKWEDGAPDVGSCPAGAAACGALDMAGTIWEACSSSYKDYPRGAAGLQKDFTVGEWDAPWRGNAYHSSSSYVRCGARYRILPRNGVNALGFRVIVAPRLAHLS